MTQLRYAVSFTNRDGEQRTVIVELTQDEIGDCNANPRTAQNIAFSYVLSRASLEVPRGFSLDAAGISRVD
jgi:hypothetical protein